MVANGIGDLNARFTDAMVLEAREAYRAGTLNPAALAAIQRVSRRTVRSLLNGTTYSHLNHVCPPPLPVRSTVGRPRVHNAATLTPRVRELRARALTNTAIGDLLGLDPGTVSRLYNHGAVRPRSQKPGER